MRSCFRKSKGRAAATLERRANKCERPHETAGAHVLLDDSWRILIDDSSCAVVALRPSERGDNDKWNFDESSDPARCSGLLLPVPILSAAVSVGDLMFVAGGPAFTCGQVLHANADADSPVIHELGGVDPDLARRIFAPKCHNPVTDDTVSTSCPCDTYGACVRTRRPRDLDLLLFPLACDGTLPRSVARALITSGAAVAALHFGL